MTIGAWVLWILLSLFIIAVGCCIGVGLGDGIAPAIIGALTGVIIAIVMLLVMRWYFNSTADGARALKTQESNLNKGIPREVTVYDVNGNIVKEYKGRFDVVYDDDRILFDDENGLRHIIYYPTGTVTIDELKEDVE